MKIIMNNQPSLRSNRLILRPFSLQDAPEVQRLAGDWDIADKTLNIPHPYEDGMAEEWIRTHPEEFKKMRQVVYAIVHQKENYLIGAIGLSSISKEAQHAEMGYWIGKPYWNHGYCTEAAHVVLKYAFGSLKLNKVYAHYLTRNPASGRVMEKIGMKLEGTLRKHVQKWDVLEDIHFYGILKEEFELIDNKR